MVCTAFVVQLNKLLEFIRQWRMSNGVGLSVQIEASQTVLTLLYDRVSQTASKGVIAMLIYIVLVSLL